jgi:AraC-like DNA-binding protein
MRAMVSGLIRDDRLGDGETTAGRADVAARLGLSETTLRRRLQAEGTTFRTIKQAVHDDLAKEWPVAGE